MIKKLSVLMLVLVIGVLCLASCKITKPDEPVPDGPQNETIGENTIYNSGSELTIIMGEGADPELSMKLAEDIAEARGKAVSIFSASSAEQTDHEIVIGKTDRQISKTALMRLNREIDDYVTGDESTYVIYSDGASIAVVFNEDYDKVAMGLAYEALTELCSGKTLVKPSGPIDINTFDLVDDYYTPLDIAHKNEIIEQVREIVGDETTNALLTMTNLYDYRLYEWIANLYDPCICVCKGLGEEECQNTKYCRAQGGGFYFANSARDTVGFLPDVETTRQALDFLDLSGMTWMYGGNYEDGALPVEMLRAIGRYTQALQCPDGYFRHPQWSHLEDKDMRLNRDLGWSTTLLNAAVLPFVYDTPHGHSGAGIPSWMQDTSLTSSLSASPVTAVSKVIAVANHPAVLESVETFKAFVESEIGDEIRTSSYGNGSRLATYSGQIVARDKEIGTPDNPTPIMSYLIDWLNSHMNPDRGTWVWDDANGGNSKQMGKFAETNGVMKISGLYGAARVSWPNGIKAMQICAEVLVNDEYPTGSVDIYNAWISLKSIYNCMTNYGTETERAEAEAFMQSFRMNATEAVNVSRDKMAYFKRPDGSFSYPPALNSAGKFQGGSGISMGMPTQVAGLDEGDVNGALIASADTWGYICESLGIPRIPLFGSAEMHKFRKIIEDSNPVIKQGANFEHTVVDFEDEEVGDEPSIGINLGNRSDGVSNKVVYDEEKENNYLEFITTSTYTAPNTTSGDSIYVICESQSAAAKSYVFEGDFCVIEADNTNAYQVFVGSCHILFIRIVNGEVRLVEGSSDSTGHSLDRDLGVAVNKGDWFRLKVVYYLGDHDTVRVKIYFDDLSDGENELQLLAVTDNYYSKYGEKFEAGGSTPSTAFKNAHIYSYSHLNGKLLLDNLAAYRTKDEYVAETDPDKQPLVYNIDPPDSDEKVYDFEDGNIPSDFKVSSGEPSVVSGELSLGLSAKLSLPINVRTAGSKCATASFYLNCTSAAVGSDVLTVTFTEPLGDIITLIFRVAEGTDGKYITCVEKNETEGSVISGVKIPVGNKTKVTIDYHHDQDVALIFVGDTFVGASGAIFKNAERRTAASLVISSSAKNVSATIDDLIFEKNKNSYDEATKPNKNSVIYGFDSENADVKLSDSGASIVNKNYFGSLSNAVQLVQGSAAKPAYLSVPVNQRANLYSLLTLEAALRFESATVDGHTHNLNVKDSAGNVIYSIAIKVNGSLVELYEVGARSVAAQRLASTSKNGAFTLKLEIYPAEKIVNVYINGTCVAKSSIFKDIQTLSADPAFFEIETAAVRSTLGIDNVKAETVYELYESVEASAEKNTDSSNPLDFEKSNTGSLPEKMISSAVNFRVENVYNTITGQYSNVGVLDTIRGRNETVGTKLDKKNTASCVTFETDFKISNVEYEHIAQIFFSTDKGQGPTSNAYGMIISQSGSGFTIKDYAGGSIKTTLVEGLTFDTWYRLKVEYFIVGDGTAKIRVYIDNDLKYVTDNHYQIGKGDALAEIQQVMFYTFLDGKCTIMVDNMSITTSNATCTDTVGKK